MGYAYFWWKLKFYLSLTIFAGASSSAWRIPNFVEYWTLLQNEWDKAFSHACVCVLLPLSSTSWRRAPFQWHWSSWKATEIQLYHLPLTTHTKTTTTAAEEKIVRFWRDLFCGKFIHFAILMDCRRALQLNEAFYSAYYSYIANYRVCATQSVVLNIV